MPTTPSPTRSIVSARWAPSSWSMMNQPRSTRSSTTSRPRPVRRMGMQRALCSRASNRCAHLACSIAESHFGFSPGHWLATRTGRSTNEQAPRRARPLHRFPLIRPGPPRRHRLLTSGLDNSVASDGQFRHLTRSHRPSLPPGRRGVGLPKSRQSLCSAAWCPERLRCAVAHVGGASRRRSTHTDRSAGCDQR